MGNKHILAQLGVFALLGLNVGAYYVFWPHKENSAQAESQTKGQARLVPDKDPPPQSVFSSPREIPAQVINTAVPLQIINPPAKWVEPDEDEAVRKLLRSIQKEDSQQTDFDVPALAVRTLAEDQRPSNLPPAEKGVAATSALTPQVAPSPWLLNMEMVGGQTQLLARLKQPLVSQKLALEFRISCDRLEVKSPGAMQAVGNVSVAGAGLKGTCQRLTLPLNETQLIFEEQAKITHDSNPGNALSGDRIIWEPTPSVDAQPGPLRENRPYNLFPLTPPSLGRPD